MITAKPTEHLTGILLEGSYDDFLQIVNSIYNITIDHFEGDDLDPYRGVKNRLLGICYDIRHAYQGDRNIVFADNGVNDEMMKWHKTILPKKAVHFSVELLFPEAVFVALSAPDLFIHDYSGYKTEDSAEEDKYRPNFSAYYIDKAVIDTLSGVILGCLEEVIGVNEFYKLMKRRNTRVFSTYSYYLPQYVDKCNVEYLNTSSEKRADKIRNITKRFISHPSSYYSMLESMKSAAQDYGCSIYEIRDTRIKYPEDDIEW